MKNKILASAAAACIAACMTVTTFADSTSDINSNITSQCDVYQSAKYCEALDHLKQAEREFMIQEALADRRSNL